VHYKRSHLALKVVAEQEALVAARQQSHRGLLGAPSVAERCSICGSATEINVGGCWGATRTCSAINLLGPGMRACGSGRARTT
jgi:hypothetical protein